MISLQEYNIIRKFSVHKLATARRNTDPGRNKFFDYSSSEMIMGSLSRDR